MRFIRTICSVYERAIFSKAAIELLGESLKKTVSKRKLAAAAQKEVA